VRWFAYNNAMTSVGLPTFETWKRFEGQIVNREFHLHQYLGGSDYAGVFLTQRSLKEKAAIKLILEDPRYAELQLARWRMAEELTHPNLLRIFGSGRCEFDGQSYLYVLMEYADENLAHILPHRPLTPVEARDMLQPLAATLAFLHDKGIVHGHVKPANIMAVEDHLKFSSDSLSTEPDSGERPDRRTPYDAPEIYDAPLTPAADVWSLGMTLVEVFNQRLPTRSGAELMATGMPAPFGDIARNCLRIDPKQRWSIPGILARLEGPPSSPPIQLVPRPAEKASRSPARQQARPTGKPNLLTRYLVAVAVALVVIAIAAVTNMRKHPAAAVPSQTSTVSQATGSARTPANAAASGVNTPAGPAAHPPAASSGSSKGAIRKEVQPNVSASAQQTVQGHLKVAVRVSVSPSGDVVGERFESPGPSRYFSRVSMEAARQWKFKPPQVAGQNVPSEWILHFEFTNAGTRVTTSQVSPKT
jgi:TonB family protein